MTTAPLAELWLASTEHEAWASPRRCTLVERARGPWPDGETYLAVLDPAAAAPGGSRAVWVLRPRHEEVTIVPASSWPLYVHVARPADDGDIPDWVEPEDLAVEAWCELYRDREQATAAMRASWPELDD